MLNRLFSQCTRQSILVALVLLISTPILGQSLVEQLSVNSNQKAPTYATTTFSPGTLYRIEVTGFYYFNNFPGLQRRQADAEYQTEDYWGSYFNPGDGLDLLVVYGSSIGTPIFDSAWNITAQDADWGPYNVNHTYNLVVLGNGGNIGFVISDYWGNAGECMHNWCTFDNLGSLTVKIFQLGITVIIDIKPGSFPNSINPKSKGVIPVAILTTDASDNTNPFDASSVDVKTVRFGKTGTEAAPIQSALEDVDGDGDLDRILHFKTQDTGIQCGDTSASLTGVTLDGQTIKSSDSINTVGCKQVDNNALKLTINYVVCFR